MHARLRGLMAALLRYKEIWKNTPRGIIKTIRRQSQDAGRGSRPDFILGDKV